MTDTNTYRPSDTHTNVEFAKVTHQRLTAAQRDSESIAATIDRALDAYDREQAMPNAVRGEVRATAPTTPADIWRGAIDRIKTRPEDYDEDDDGMWYDVTTVERAYEYLKRREPLPAEVRTYLRRADAATNFRIWNDTHQRMRDCDAGDTFDATIAAALDALERGEKLPAAVEEVCNE